MVVNDIQEDRYAARMTGFDQSLQPIRAAVSLVIRGIGVCRIIAPIVGAGKLRNWQDLNGADA